MVIDLKPLFECPNCGKRIWHIGTEHDCTNSSKESEPKYINLTKLKSVEEMMEEINKKMKADQERWFAQFMTVPRNKEIKIKTDIVELPKLHMKVEDPIERQFQFINNMPDGPLRNSYLRTSSFSLFGSGPIARRIQGGPL